MKTQTMSPMEACEEYLDRGWNIVRVWGLNPDLSCQCGDPECQNPGKHPQQSWEVCQTKRVPLRLAKVFFREPNPSNIGVVCGEISQIVVIDEDRLGAADQLDLPETLRCTTHDGRRHFYFKHPGVDYGAKIRFAPDLDYKGSGYVVAPPSRHASGQYYTWVNPGTPLAELPEGVLDRLEMAAPAEDRQSVQMHESDWEKPCPKGERNDTLTRLAGSALGRGMPYEEVLEKSIQWGLEMCDPPYTDQKELTRTVKGIAQSESRKQKERFEISDTISLHRGGELPKPLREPAYHGIVGDILRKIEPFIEPGPPAILVQTLLYFGCVIGNRPYFDVDEEPTHTNIFAFIIGKTSQSRKGTSWKIVKSMFRDIEVPKETRPGVHVITHPLVINPGISTGEGIINALRDPVPATETEPAIPGVVDKRILMISQEFGGVLKKEAKSNTPLLQTLRACFDSETLSNLTLNPYTATNPHLAMIGQCTPEELVERFSASEKSGGTANRFLWILATRAQRRPEGSKVDPEVMSEVRSMLKDAYDFARNAGRMTRDPEAQKYFNILYGHGGQFERDEDHPLQDMFGRGPIIVVKLSMIYALLDKTTIIRKEHLEAAMEIWRYSKDTILYLYGGSSGDTVGDSMLNFLEGLPTHSATYSKLKAAFSDVPSMKFRETLAMLVNNNLLLETEDVRTKPGPLPKTYTLLNPKEKKERN